MPCSGAILLSPRLRDLITLSLGMNIMGLCTPKAPVTPPSTEVRKVKRGIVMAKVIEFYVPTIFRKPLSLGGGSAGRLSSFARRQGNPPKQ